MMIRPERPEDTNAIFELTKLAFEGKPYAAGDEQDVVDRLRDVNALSLSLVAVIDDEVVGQITFSEALITETEGQWMALGPVSVLPRLQSEGIGGALIKEGLAQVKSDGALGCILTGNPQYYQRFGFEFSNANAPLNEPEEFFMLKLLGDQKPVGRFSFHPAFYGEV